MRNYAFRATISKHKEIKENRPCFIFEIGMSMREVERGVIEMILKRYEGNKTKTAGALGISRKTLYNKLRKYNLLHR